MALHIIDEANRCLNCKKPMCQQGCPVHTPIPIVIQLFKENRLMEAGDMLFRNNPMSAVCSIVCNHEMQCAGHCIRGRKDMEEMGITIRTNTTIDFQNFGSTVGIIHAKINT